MLRLKKEWWIVFESNEVFQRRRGYSPLQSPVLLTIHEGTSRLTNGVPQGSRTPGFLLDREALWPLS